MENKAHRKSGDTHTLLRKAKLSFARDQERNGRTKGPVLVLKPEKQIKIYCRSKKKKKIILNILFTLETDTILNKNIFFKLKSVGFFS